MEFLQETVLGSKCAVSTTSLSLSQRISLVESQALLESFYQKYRDSLDALYKCKSTSGFQTTISIVSEDDLDNLIGDKRLYMIKTAGSVENAQLSDLAHQCRELQINRPISELKATGFILNPLLVPEFRIASQIKLMNFSQKTANPSEVKPRTTLAKTLEQTVKSAQIVNSDAPQKRAEVASEDKLSSSSAKLSADHSRKAASEVPPTAPKKDIKRQSVAFPFPKTDKAAALRKSAFDRKPMMKPVNEKVVLAEDDGQDEEMGDESGDFTESPNLDRENELKNLESLFDNDNKMDVDSEASLVVEGTTVPSHVNPQDHEGTTMLDNSPAVVLAKGQTLDDDTSSRSTSNESNIVIDPETGKKMHRIKKTIHVDEEDEEGFVVRKNKVIDVLVEVDENESPLEGAERKELNKNKPSSTSAPQPSSRPSSSTATTNKPAAKTTNAKQGSLMSFFNVRKK